MQDSTWYLCPSDLIFFSRSEPGLKVLQVASQLTQQPSWLENLVIKNQNQPSSQALTALKLLPPAKELRYRYTIKAPTFSFLLFMDTLILCWRLIWLTSSELGTEVINVTVQNFFSLTIEFNPSHLQACFLLNNILPK